MRIANALSAEQPLMTTTLLPGLLEAAAKIAPATNTAAALLR